jgi:drug/metabolite transporter (DMT)-like permease
MQVIVPSIGSGTGAGLNGWRGWLGFGLSLASMATTVVYFVSLQASRRLGFTSLQLQYLYLLLSVAVLLPISLGVDGTDWPANFRGWTAADWAVLVVMSCCVVISANLCIQYSTWVLGAPTVSMFYGLRLVAAIVESNLILGTTVIKEPVQIAGTVITVCAVTVYMVLQWRRSKQQAQAEAGTGSPPSSSQLQAQEAAQPPLRQPAEP